MTENFQGNETRQQTAAKPVSSRDHSVERKLGEMSPYGQITEATQVELTTVYQSEFPLVVSPVKPKVHPFVR